MHDRGPILVTGGTGYLATFCIARLLSEGYAVRTTVRSPARRAEVVEAVANLDSSGGAGRVEFVEADLTRDAGWADVVRGAAGVLHVASPFPSTPPKSDDEIVRPARDGALRVLAAARDAGVARVVMTSSTAAVAYGRGGRTTPFDESDWSDETNRSDSNAYERSKTIAERAAWEWLGREGGALELTTVNPGAILGPIAGRDISTSINIVKTLLDGSIAGLARFGWPLADVRDIADLHVRALKAPAAAGQRYIGAGPFFWLSDIAEVLRSRVPHLARRVPQRSFPNWVVRATGRFNPVIKQRLFELDVLRPVSADKAKRELGWTPRSNEDAIVATATSLTAAGLVRA